ncbi:MAG: LysM peptidoglycan-binding domain-containing protein [Anaerolineae bacterium]|nr:LysM peptidoglycan-binding domain-containing protein [Anaerolineae bacterium]
MKKRLGLIPLPILLVLIPLILLFTLGMDGVTGGDEPTPDSGGPVTSPPAGTCYTVTVEAGEGLFSIGREYGWAYWELANFNNIHSPGMVVHPGDTIYIPCLPAGICQRHLVKTGEYLAQLEKKYGVTEEQLLELNPGIFNPDILYPGWYINIPCTGPMSGTYYTGPDNFCAIGMPWEGQCDDGLHSWTEGYEALRSQQGCPYWDNNRCYLTGDCVSESDWINGYRYCNPF